VALTDEKYMLFTTFRRDGRPVATPVWVADLGDGRIGFWTSSGSGKAKRLAHTSSVLVQPSNARGVVKPGTHAVQATATLVAGPELDAIRQRVYAKYGFATKVTKLLASVVGTLRGRRVPYGDRGVVVQLPAGA
jgi:PPOX class probable F420-dependent enzyme